MFSDINFETDTKKNCIYYDFQKSVLFKTFSGTRVEMRVFRIAV